MSTSNSPNTNVKTAGNITWKDLDSGVVVLNLDSGTYYLLNETASEAWRAFQEGKGLDEIVDHFLEEFECTKEQAQQDLDELFDYFVSDGFLVSC